MKTVTKTDNKNISRTTAVLGGTFDPPHLGHIQLAEEVIKSNLANNVLFIPAALPPHKNAREISPFYIRKTMLQLAIKDKKNFRISLLEHERLPEPSFTLKTMRILSKMYHQETFRLLIGSDNLLQLHSWYHADELVRKYPLIIYPRSKTLPTKEDLLTHWPSEYVEKLLKQIVHLPIFQISSTEIRNMIAKNKNADKFLNKEVLSFIRKNRLY